MPLDVEARLQALEEEGAKLERLLHTGGALADNPLPLAGDLVDLGEVPIAKMYQTGAQTLTTSTWTTITMDVLDFDFIGSGVDLSTEEITIRRSGIYLVMGRVSYATNTTGGRYVGFSVNSGGDPDERFGGFDPTAASIARPSATIPLSLAAGDTVELMGWQGSGGNLNTAVDAPSRSYLAVMLVAND